MKNEIFISYRRKDGWELARLIYQELTANKYSVFFDLEKLFKGKFGEHLNQNVSGCKIFIPVLIRHTLDRCVKDKDDWVKNEILTAIKLNKIIIPVIDESFIMPKGIDKSLAALTTKKYKSVRINKNNFDESMKQLCSYIIDALIKINKDEEQTKVADRFTVDAFKQENTKQIELQCNKTDEDLNNEASEIVNASYYSNAFDQKEFDSIIEKMSENFISGNILEIGCRDGFDSARIARKLGGSVQNYVGIEPYITAFKIAKKVYSKVMPQYGHVYNYFPNDVHFKDKLMDISKQLNVLFDVVLIRHSLIYYKNPQFIIESVKNVMSPGGKIIIVESDAGLNFSFPDDLLLIKEYKEIKNIPARDGNPYTGREVYSYLKKAGFNNIKLVTSLEEEFSEDNVNGNIYMGFISRKEKFLNEYNAVVDYYEQIKSESGINAIGNLKKLALNKDALIKAICSTNTFNATTTLIYTAIKE